MMIASAKPRKQRKYRYNAPLHIRSHFVNAHLSDELSKKHKKRAMTVRAGDKVKIMRGQFRGKEGLVKEVDLKNCVIFVEGITRQKVNGQDTFVSLQPSNLMIISLKDEAKRGKVN